MAFAAGHAQTAQAATTDDHVYTVTRTDEEWRERLDPISHYVLRQRGTEAPRTGPYWMSNDVGTYCCKGCDLTLYDSLHKVDLDRGWTFFRHARTDTILTDIDFGQENADDPFAQMQAMMEAHCRRCGSHLGHIVALPEMPGRPLHCINGFALRFETSKA
jgi:peptide-methionine (R)-S-oxide reductase